MPPREQVLCVWVPWTSRGRISCAVTHRQPASLRRERTRTFLRETALHHTSRIHIPAAATGSPPPSPRNSLAVRVYSRVCHVVCHHGMIQGPAVYEVKCFTPCPGYHVQVRTAFITTVKIAAFLLEDTRPSTPQQALKLVIVN